MHQHPTRILNVVILAFCVLAPSVNAESIHRELQKRIPGIISYLNEHGHKNVGVLKFRVQKLGEKLSDRVGSLNSLLADRLEVGLILGNPFDKTQQLNIIRDASAQVARLDGASHLSTQGRLAIFQPNYQIAWGEKSVAADAFLTGIVQVHDNKRVTVAVLCFDRSGGKLTRVGQTFQGDLDASSLGELGESFVLRGAFDGGTVKSDEDLTLTAVQSAAEVKSQAVSFPLNDPEASVRLEIRYDGVAVPVELRNGRAFVAEPRQNQKVEFVLTRGSNIPGRIGVVLKVNGENTLYRQTNRDHECSKWILSPQHPTTTVGGYQLSGGQRQDFAVLSDAESAARAMDYGRHTGQIQLTVFPEASSTAQSARQLVLDDDAEDLIAMLRGIHPDDLPPNLSALKHQIRLGGKHGLQTRGLIVDGQESSNNIKTVSFQSAQTPAMAVTITYRH